LHPEKMESWAFVVWASVCPAGEKYVGGYLGASVLSEANKVTGA